MTDYDIPGIHIASKLEGVIWLGVDERMLEHFGITHEDKTLVVGYHPKKRLLKETIDEILEDERFAHIDREFLKSNKIEIDAVLATQTPQRLWDYMVKLLEKEHPTRDYTRVISTRPSDERLSLLYPRMIRGLLNWAVDRIDEITKDLEEEVEEQLEEMDGFIDVGDKENEIYRRYGEIITEDPKLKEVAKALEELNREKGLGIGEDE